MKDLEAINKLAMRFNIGKVRHGLVPNESMHHISKRFTKGAAKYEVDNWKKGLHFSEIIDSMERHINAIKSGEFIDDDWEEGINKAYGYSTHMDGVAVNAMMLLHHWFNHYPSDLPIHGSNVRIGLDLDGVCADTCKHFDIEALHYRDKKFYNKWMDAIDNNKSSFEGIPLTEAAKGIVFEPVVYITARCESVRENTEKWLENSGLPWAPIVFTRDKAEACKMHGVDTFVEDNFDNFQKLRREGIRCFLLDQPYNRKYLAGPENRLRIYHLNNIINNGNRN